MSESIPNKNFVVYKSSAGSGKTFTLVKEYMLLALKDTAVPPQKYRQITAITFTNKAAGEMKERIIKALKDLAADNYTLLSKNAQSLLAAIKQDAPELNDELIQQRSKNILTSILHNYSDFAISTIDSFVHKIVRTFAFDLKIPLDFEIQTDSEKLLQQSIDLLISKIGTDDALTKVLIDFTESKTDDEKSWNIEDDLKIFAKELLNEDGILQAEKLKALQIPDFFSIKESLIKQIDSFENKIQNIAQQAIECIQKNGLDFEDFYQGKKGIANYFKNFSEKNFNSLQPNSHVQKTIDDDKWYTDKKSETIKNSINSIKPKLLEFFKQISSAIDTYLPQYKIWVMVNEKLYSLAVLNEIEKLMQEYKAENSIVHISDFNKKISEIVLTQPVPYIYERLGERYKNYLIDEFQDTSTLQFHNLLPLIDNSLSENQFTMLVGDAKQAIYRWRGGDVEQFDSLPEINQVNSNPIIKEREEALKRNFTPKFLYKNYRSKKEIIEFNNDFFRTIANALHQKQKKIYDSLEQEFDPNNTGGYIQLEFLDDSNKIILEEENLKRIIETINDTLENGYNYADIAILVSKNKEGSIIANELSKHNIPLISPDSLLLDNSEEIALIISLLEYIQNPENKISQVKIIELLIKKSIIKEFDLNECIKEINDSDFISFLKKYNINLVIHKLSQMDLYELCEHLIQVLKINEQPNAYIQFFLDEVHIYSLSVNNYIADFLSFWEERKKKASVILPKGINAVSIMTIHASKGLEFPVVILPFLNGELSLKNKTIWIEPQEIASLPAAIVSYKKELMETAHADSYETEKNKTILDRLNVLYVGLTRPEQQLYIFTGKLNEKIVDFAKSTDFFCYYLLQKNLMDSQKSIYSFGTKTKTTHSIKKQETGQNINSFYSVNWRNMIKMRTAAPTIWNTEFAENKRSYGVLLHTALSKIKTKNDLDNAISEMLNEGMITQDEIIKLKPELTKIIQHPLITEYFTDAYTIKNESEIIDANGNIFRTDRVNIHGNKAIIIDYKTGEKKSGHKKQLDEYARLLTEMNYTVTQKLLVYINKEIEIESC